MKRSALGANVGHHKKTHGMKTAVMPLPTKIILPMQMHIGAPCTPTVNKGDEVYVGTVVGKAGGFVSADIHSGVSGKVSEIGTLRYANGASVTAVTIIPDGKQTPAEDFKTGPFEVNSPQTLVEAAQKCGLVGLGGAGFPTAVKLAPKDISQIDTLIINGAECEAYITADNSEFLECSDTVMSGIAAVKNALGIKKVVVGIERNKPEAIDLMFSLTQNDSDIKIMPLKSNYPQGAEKVLIYKATGREVPRGKLPSDVGVIVMNVTTVSTLGKFINTGIPLTTKRLTVDGSCVKNAQNVRVIIGTPISEVLSFCGGISEETGKIITGGPMMGVSVVTTDFPVLKQNNAILAISEAEASFPEPSACMRCGRCISACPMGLSPVEIANAHAKNDVDMLNKLMVDLCMSCGTCTFVCPAKRHVSQTMALAKIAQKNGKGQ